MPEYGRDWVTQPVAVRWTCWDDMSRAFSSSISKVVSSEGFNQGVTGTCYDIAGNQTSDMVHGINIDMTPPTGVTLLPTGILGTNGWYTSDVTIRTTSDADISTPVVCTSDQNLTTDTSSMSFYGSCTNAAALTSPIAEVIVKRDATPPTIEFSKLTGVTGLNGWYLGDVTSIWECADDLSGPLQEQASVVISSEGSALTATAACFDIAGNTASDSRMGIKIDKRAPNVNLDIRGDTGNNGWYTSEVIVFTEGMDSTSGIGNCSPPRTIAQDTPGEFIEGTCTDIAGQSAEDKVYIKRDPILL